LSFRINSLTSSGISTSLSLFVTPSNVPKELLVPFISLGFDEIKYEESSISGWYMGIENPKYTIYSRSVVNPVQPNIWATSGTSDIEIINFINRTTNVGNPPFTSVAEAFYYVGTKPENFIIRDSYPNITLQDLVLNYDTGEIMGNIIRFTNIQSILRWCT